MSVVASDEGRQIFEDAARYYLDMNGDEFLRRWDAEELDPEDSLVMRVVMLIPFAREPA